MIEGPARRTGGCLCGAVRYEVSGAPESANLCHCVTCRRAAGAPVVGWATFPLDAFRWTATPPAEFASSPGITRTHCAACGTSLTYRVDPAGIDITLASLDRPEDLPPDHEAWTDHRLAWIRADPALPQE